MILKVFQDSDEGKRWKWEKSSWSTKRSVDNHTYYDWPC
jgi:hypothetical protein